jgi:hypothetical protein
LATQINFDAIFVGGVFNGPAQATIDPSHRAKIPSLVNNHVNASAGTIISAIDVERGIYYRRHSNIPSYPGGMLSLHAFNF